jgi:hypothetical protein
VGGAGSSSPLRKAASGVSVAIAAKAATAGAYRGLEPLRGGAGEQLIKYPAGDELRTLARASRWSVSLQRARRVSRKIDASVDSSAPRLLRVGHDCAADKDPEETVVGTLIDGRRETNSDSHFVRSGLERDIFDIRQRAGALWASLNLLGHGHPFPRLASEQSKASAAAGSVFGWGIVAEGSKPSVDSGPGGDFSHAVS